MTGRTAEEGQESQAMVDIAAGETSTWEEICKHVGNRFKNHPNRKGRRGGQWDLSADQDREKRFGYET